jgi:integrase
LGDVADLYVKARGGHRHYYLEGIRDTAVPAAGGSTIKLGLKPIDDVTTADIKHALAAWRSRKRARAGAKGGAVAERHFIASGRHLFSWAIAEGHVKHSPFYSAQGLPVIHIKGTRARKRRLEEGEEERILAAASPQMADFFTAMLETGCRPGELRTLQWSEVQADKFTVLASKAKDREDREVQIEPTLRAILDRRRNGPDGKPLPVTAYVFGNEVGELIDRRHLCGMWIDTCKAAKVTNLHLHDLRREFASQMSEAGVPIQQVRDALGHANITMTNTYLGLNRDEQKQAYKQRTAHRARQRMKAV